MKLKNVFTVVLVFIVGFQLQAQCNDKSSHQKEMAYHDDVRKQGDIVDIAASLDDFSTLVAAVKAAELVETLKSEGPFTVFAPTNKAFAKLPEGTLETLLKPENKSMLTGILTYHVVSGKVMAADVVAAIKSNDGAFTVKTVNGGTLTASIVDGNVILTDAKGNTSTINKTDVEASNGVIHVIDTVVLPE